MEQQAEPLAVWWDPAADVVWVRWAPGAVIDLAAARASVLAVRALDRTGIRLLVDMRRMGRIDRDARALYEADQADAVAMALLVGSAVNRMIANFFIGMTRSPIPVRMFTDAGSATDWLREQR